MESEDLVLKAKHGSKKARKRLLKKYPKTFKILLEQEEEQRKAEEEKRRIEEEKQRKENEEKKRIEDERRQKEEERESQKRSEHQRKIGKIEQILSSTEEENNRVGNLKEYIVRTSERPRYGEVKRGPSAWGMIEYGEIIGTDIIYNLTLDSQVKVTKREALIRAVIEEKELSFLDDENSSFVFEECEDELLQAQIEDTLNLPYKGQGIFLIKLDDMEYQIPCDIRMLETFSEEGIKGVKYIKKPKINLANIKQAIQRRFYKEER